MEVSLRAQAKQSLPRWQAGLEIATDRQPAGLAMTKLLEKTKYLLITSLTTQDERVDWKKENMKKEYLLVLGVFALSAILSAFAWLTGMGRLTLPSISSQTGRSGFAKFLSKKIASLTTPVTKVVGRVDKLEGDVLWVTQRFPEGDRTLEISITKDTQIIKPRPFIPYLLKTVHADVADLQTRADLIEGTLVTVTNPVPASVVEITVYNTSIQGTISEVRGNTFTMNAAVPLLPPNIPTTQLEQAKERTYTVTYTTGSTELSRKKNGESLKVHPDELKPGTTVTVYATTDVTLLTSIPAVLIRFADL